MWYLKSSILLVLCTLGAKAATLYSDDFCGDSSDWTALSGTWDRTDCTYEQTDDELGGAYAWIGDATTESWSNYSVTWKMTRDSSCNGRSGVLARASGVTGVNKEGKQYFIAVGNSDLRVQKYEDGSMSVLYDMDIDEDTTDQELTVEATLEGSTITAQYWLEDGTYYTFSVEDDSISEGVVGFRTHTCATVFDTIEVSELPDTFVSDDFCGDDSNWSALSGTWTRSGCTYESDGTTEGAYAWIGDAVTPTSWSDYTVTWKMTRDSSCSGRSGVLVRSTGITGTNREGEQYFIGVGNSDIMVKKYDDGIAETLYDQDVSDDTDTTEQLITGYVTVEGSEITVGIAFESGEGYSFSIEDDSFSVGVLGLRSYKCQTVFESVKVTGVAPTVAPTKAPSMAPTKQATLSPSKAPTRMPTKAPTKMPTKAPTKMPTKAPTKSN